jgi:plasmid maintenance system antidote protein VapI
MSRSSIITRGYFMSRTPIHPGEHLAEELKGLGISAAELSRQIDVPVNRITAIINGQRGVTADPRYGLATGSAPARSFGSTFKSFTNCASRAKKSVTRLISCPRADIAECTSPRFRILLAGVCIDARGLSEIIAPHGGLPGLIPVKGSPVPV